MRPKKWGGGGLGIRDIEFSRALHVRWLWNNWDSQNIHWKGLLKITESTDRALFFTFTIVQFENGLNTPFSEAKWVQGATLET
jgi:hypothetical protein